MLILFDPRDSYPWSIQVVSMQVREFGLNLDAEEATTVVRTRVHAILAPRPKLMMELA